MTNKDDFNLFVATKSFVYKMVWVVFLLSYTKRDIYSIEAERQEVSMYWPF